MNGTKFLLPVLPSLSVKFVSKHVRPTRAAKGRTGNQTILLRVSSLKIRKRSRGESFALFFGVEILLQG